MVDAAGSIDDAEGWDLAFHDVGVTIGDTVALASASGKAAAGNVLALMGPSGAGKTTLLNALARRGPVTKGSISYGGRAWSKALKRRIAFVEQDDIVYPGLTVRQSVTFLARLRLPQGTTDEQVETRVNETLSILKLNKCADSLIGSALVRGISGGERKRLCIAQELLVDPKVILLDEPTSGLDSSIAYVVASMLHDLAKSRKICIIASIHQPSSQVFHTFDELLMLNKGLVAYRGGVKDVQKYFTERHGMICPQDYNPSDYVMDLAVQGQLSDESVLAKLEEDFGKGSVEDSKQAARAGDGVDSKASRYTQPWMAQFKILVDREWTLTRPNLWSWQSFILYVGQALLSGILWFRLGFDEEDIFSRLTATFGIGIPWMFFPLLDALPLFPTSMVNLRKELGVGAYRLSAWYWCKTTVAMSNYLVWPILHVSVFYWMANLNPLAASYFALLGLILVSIVMYHSLGLLIAASTSPDKMMTVALLLVTFMFLFTGVFIPLDESALPFLGYINPVLYTFFAQLAVVFGIGDETYDCAGNGETIYTDSCDSEGNGEIDFEDIRDEFDVFLGGGPSVGIILAFLVFFRVAAYVQLRRSLEAVINPPEHISAHVDSEESDDVKERYSKMVENAAATQPDDEVKLEA
uniref:ABC transporter domain-containing protein n=1 Tax=Pinguiococcus pyrenoidosus TaxID=172671 RepID=A0A7R9YCU9_9STRA|mmetsp:Transcript_2281/g.9819  ORF Transcript_2281/g.9819 Transcript_2281/m.9819 type:complete len:639 (+) Transcript_2281:69-1985(+)